MISSTAVQGLMCRIIILLNDDRVIEIFDALATSSAYASSEELKNLPRECASAAKFRN